MPTDTVDGFVPASPSTFTVYAIAAGTEPVSRSSEWVRTSDVPSTVALSGAGARFALTLTSWPSIQAKFAGRLQIWMPELTLLPAFTVNFRPAQIEHRAERHVGVESDLYPMVIKVIRFVYVDILDLEGGAVVNRRLVKLSEETLLRIRTYVPLVSYVPTVMVAHQLLSCGTWACRRHHRRRGLARKRALRVARQVGETHVTLIVLSTSEDDTV